MAFEANQKPIPGLVANADLSTHQFKFVDVNSSGKVILNVTAGAAVLGVLQDKPDAADKVATVVGTGGGQVSKVKAGATVASGALVMSDTAGLAITATGTNTAMGKALVGGAANELITVALCCYGIR